MSISETLLAERLETRLCGLVDAEDVTGVSVACAWQTKTWVQAAGSVGSHDKFLIYSLTKTMLAVLVMKLVESGELDLDARLSAFAPEYPFAGQVTIRQLLNHSAGLPDYGSLKDYRQDLQADPLHPWTDETFLARTGGKLVFEPGTSFGYSNIGYMILRRLVEKLSGRTLAEFVAGEITLPLGLVRTRVIENLEQMQDLAPAASPLWEYSLDVRSRYHPGWVAHGVVGATAKETLSFYRELFCGGLVTPRSLADMTTMVPVATDHPFFRQPGYGLGLMGDGGGNYGPVYGHTGDGPGYCASAYHFGGNQDGFTVIAMANCEGSARTDKIAFALADEAFYGSPY